MDTMKLERCDCERDDPRATAARASERARCSYQSAEPRTRSEPAREQPAPAIATLKDKFSGGGCTR